MIQLIGISGYAGVGKDTLARYIYTHYKNVYKESFADPLKDACSAAFGIPRESFDDQMAKKLSDPYWRVSPRQIIQFVGTEVFREKINDLLSWSPNQENFWTRRLRGKLQGTLLLAEEGAYEDNDTIIVPDIRFQDEVEFIYQNKGVVISLQRSGHEGNVGISNHISESGISKLTFKPGAHYILENNGSIPDLYNQFEQIKSSLESVNHINLTKET